MTTTQIRYKRRVTILLTDKEYDQLLAEAERVNSKVSELVRQAIRERLAKSQAWV